MKINLMLAYNFCSLGLIFVLKKNNFFFHFNRTAEPDQSILMTLGGSKIFSVGDVITFKVFERLSWTRAV